MKDSNDNRSIHPDSQCASSLRRYKAPTLTNYGDITVLTKASAANNNQTDVLWPAGAQPNKTGSI